MLLSVMSQGVRADRNFEEVAEHHTPGDGCVVVLFSAACDRVMVHA